MKRHLPRLDPGYYRGHAFVHWNLTIKDRRTGWLSSEFHRQFRELLTHTSFRYGVTCPMYCLMPDHLHMVWLGIFDESDQLKAIRYFRKQINRVLVTLGFAFQHQAYDRVLRDDECQETAFVDLCEYIARNPERKRLVGLDEFEKYPFTNCLVPGCPELDIRQSEFWPRFWRVNSFSRKHGLFRRINERFS